MPDSLGTMGSEFWNFLSNLLGLPTLIVSYKPFKSIGTPSITTNMIGTTMTWSLQTFFKEQSWSWWTSTWWRRSFQQKKPSSYPNQRMESIKCSTMFSIKGSYKLKEANGSPRKRSFRNFSTTTLLPHKSPIWSPLLTMSLTPMRTSLEFKAKMALRRKPQFKLTISWWDLPHLWSCRGF